MKEGPVVRVGRNTTRMALFVVGVLVVLSVAIWNSSYIQHEMRLRQLAKAFASRIPHPPSAMPLRAIAKVGIFQGNGNHCDYFVGQIRQAGVSRAKVSEFYQGKSLILPDGDRIPLQVVFYDDDGILPPCSVPEDCFSILDCVSPLLPNQTYYLVWCCDAGHSPGGDWRCF